MTCSRHYYLDIISCYQQPFCRRQQNGMKQLQLLFEKEMKIAISIQRIYTIIKKIPRFLIRSLNCKSLIINKIDKLFWLIIVSISKFLCQISLRCCSSRCLTAYCLNSLSAKVSHIA